MKKGISMWSFSDRSPEVCFTLAKKHGFDGVEVVLGETGPVRFDSAREELEEYKRTAKEYGIELYSVACDSCWQYSLTSDSEDNRRAAEKMIERQLEVAKVLGCNTILALPGMVQGLSPDDEVVPYDVAYERALCAMKRLALCAEKHRVVIGMENVWTKFLLSPLEMRDFIDKIGSPWVKMYFDVGNVVYCGFPEQWINILGDRIAKVHFKDFIRAKNEFTDILQGDVNYPAVMKALSDAGYDDWVTAEVFSATGDTDGLLKINSSAMDKILGR